MASRGDRARSHQWLYTSAPFVSRPKMPPVNPFRCPASKTILGILLLGMFLAFFGSLSVAAHYVPVPYDWRYHVISHLLSPSDNPALYWIPSLGVAVTGILLFPVSGYIHRRVCIVSRACARIATVAFVGGSLALILAGLIVPQHMQPVLGVKRLHEWLAHASAIGMGVGMLGWTWCAVKDQCHVLGGHRMLGWKVALAWALLTSLPLVGMVSSECLLLAARSQHSSMAPVYHVLNNAGFWHLGFWEWVGASAVYLFLLVSVLLLPDERQPRN
jgi:hypothetical protein